MAERVKQLPGRAFVLYLPKHVNDASFVRSINIPFVEYAAKCCSISSGLGICPEAFTGRLRSNGRSIAFFSNFSRLPTKKEKQKAATKQQVKPVVAPIHAQTSVRAIQCPFLQVVLKRGGVSSRSNPRRRRRLGRQSSGSKDHQSPF